MKTPNYVFDDELYHHGILGQRWGHRRFQNEDGSWTAAGRERYGEGEGPRQAAKPKVDARAKAKASFEEKKYKMYMKSKEQKLKDKIAAKEERNRVREAAKTQRLLKKEQSKVEQKGRPTQIFGKTKKMSDDDLQNAINRLKLEVEYNKNYAIASKPNGALARADRFFEGPTGKVVRDIAVATIPNVANTITTKMLDNRLKYANKFDREKIQADIDKVKADAENSRAKADQSAAIAEQNRAKIARDDRKQEADILLNRKKHQLEVAKAKTESDRADKKLADESRRSDELQKAEQNRLNEEHNVKMEAAKLANRVEEATQFGYDAGDKASKSANWVYGKVSHNLARERHQTELSKQEIQNKKNESDARAAKDWAEAQRKESEKQMALQNFKEARAERKEFNETLTRLANSGQIKITEALHSYKFGDTSQTSYKIASDEAKTPVSSKKVIDTSTNLNSLLRDMSTGIPSSKESAIRSAQGSDAEIAARFHVDPSTVWRIKNRK